MQCSCTLKATEAAVIAISCALAAGGEWCSPSSGALAGAGSEAVALTVPRDAQVTGCLFCYLCDHAVETARPPMGSSVRVLIHWAQGIVPDAVADIIF